MSRERIDWHVVLGGYNEACCDACDLYVRWQWRRNEVASHSRKDKVALGKQPGAVKAAHLFSW